MPFPPGGYPGEDQMREIQAQFAAFEERRYELMMEDRQQVRRFEAVLCCCRSWWARGQEVPNPHDGCPIHSVYLADKEGNFL
jgi:hypothetical protein